MIGMDAFYAQVRLDNPQLFEKIIAFASTFGQPHEEIAVKTRYQVERFCIELVSRGRREL